MIFARLPKTTFELDFGRFSGSRAKSKIVGPCKDDRQISYVCIDGDRVVGVLVVEKSRSGMTVASCGTIVHHAYRRDGVGKQLWLTMLRTEKPKVVRVKVISDRGYSLVMSLKKSFRKIRWRITQEGARKLRELQ
jgi:hypothetical protein